jgi:hypothetical protein
MTAILSLVITVLAFWLAQHPPAWFAAQAGGWLAWVGIVLGAWLSCLLVVLVKATVTSIDRNLSPTVKMTPVGEDKVSPALGALANQLAALGLTRATPPLSVSLTNPAVLIGFVQDGGDIASSAYSVQPPADRPAVTAFDFVSRFDGDRGGLTTSANPAGAVLPATPGALRQVFPGSDPATLFKKHREALDWLRSEGVRARPVRAAEFESLFRLAQERQRAAFLRARLRFAFTAIWRTIRKTTPHIGPVQQQPSARREIRYLLGRR